MIINNSNTHWVFVCGINSEKDNPLRHVMDIFFALNVLKRKGICSSHISVLIDPVADHLLLELPDQLPFDQVNKYSVSEFNQVVNSKPLENLVITVLGHGSPQGIDANYELKPSHLVNAIYSVDSIKGCVVIFGQCYSGIYNYINLMGNDTQGVETKVPSICFIGASGLNSSLSSTVSIRLSDNPLSWVANMFLCWFFLWIENNSGVQRDVDGDDKETLADAYKFAGANTSYFLLNEVKANIALELYSKQQELVEKQRQIVRSPDADLEIEGLKLQIKSLVSINHTVQDPWILNANKAREIVFDL